MKYDVYQITSHCNIYQFIIGVCDEECRDVIYYIVYPRKQYINDFINDRNLPRRVHYGLFQESLPILLYSSDSILDCKQYLITNHFDYFL